MQGTAFRLSALCLLTIGLFFARAAFAASDPPLAAGTLISQTPMDHAPAGARGLRIRYRSTAENGASVEITGVAFLPAGAEPKGGRPIVAWAHGTVGIAEACAPSTNPSLFENIAGLEPMLKRGYIVTATDFQGLGTPGPHPYLIGVSSGRAVLDSVRAARALPGADAGRRYVVWGESQGGHAVLWAGQLAKAYMPELDLVGIAAAAPPSDLVANFTETTSTLGHALLTGFTTESWSHIYGIKLSTFANVFGRYLIRKLARDCVHRDPVAAGTNVGMLVLGNQIPYHVSETWGKLLAQNTVKPTKFGVPLLIAQGTADTIVNPGVTQAFAAQTCRAGTTLRYISVKDGDHTTIAQRSQDETLAWIADRFGDRPAASDCDKILDSGEDRAKDP